MWPVSGATPTTAAAREPITRRPPASTPDAHSSGDGSNRPCSCSVVRQTICRMPARWGGVAASSSRRTVAAAHPAASDTHRQGDGTETDARAHFSSSSARRFVISSRNEVVGFLSSTS